MSIAKQITKTWLQVRVAELEQERETTGRRYQRQIDELKAHNDKLFNGNIPDLTLHKRNIELWKKRAFEMRDRARSRRIELTAMSEKLSLKDNEIAKLKRLVEVQKKELIEMRENPRVQYVVADNQLELAALRYKASQLEAENRKLADLNNQYETRPRTMVELEHSKLKRDFEEVLRVNKSQVEYSNKLLAENRELSTQVERLDKYVGLLKAQRELKTDSYFIGLEKENADLKLQVAKYDDFRSAACTKVQELRNEKEALNEEVIRHIESKAALHSKIHELSQQVKALKDEQKATGCKWGGTRTGRFYGAKDPAIEYLPRWDYIICDEQSRFHVGEMKLGNSDFSAIEAQALAYMNGLGFPKWFQRWLKPVDQNNMFAQFMKKNVDK